MKGDSRVPFPDHYRAVIEGRFESNAGIETERWSTSYRVVTDANPLTDGLDQDSYINNELTDFANRLFNNGLFSANVVVDKLSFNRIGPTGHYADPSRSHYKLLSGADVIRGTAGIIRYPTQISVVATLRSELDRGAGAFGRMFLPTPQCALGDDSLMTAADRDSLVARVKDAFEHADGTMGIGSIHYWPALVTSKGTAGSTHRVTRVGVGRVFDTHRTRRRSLQEQTQLVTLS